MRKVATLINQVDEKQATTLKVKLTRGFFCPATFVYNMARKAEEAAVARRSRVLLIKIRQNYR